MKNIAKYSVNKPISIFMGFLIIILLGVISIVKLPLELFPDINLPYAVVVTTYEGKNPYEVEEDVTKPIEQNLLAISNLKNIQSTSSEHFSMVMLEFEQSTNMDSAFLEMRENFELLNLKEGIGNPMIIKFDPSMMPVMVVSLSRDWGDVTDDEALIKTTEWVNEEVLSKLERTPGVASVSMSGASDTVIQIDFNDELLLQYDLTNDEVLRIIEDQNIQGIAGIVPDGNNIRMLYIGDKIVGLDNLKSTPITFDASENKIITLDDLSNNIGFVNAATNQYMKINGKQGISIAFQKQSDIGITEVVDSIQNTLSEFTESEDYDAEYVELLNQGDYIEQSIGTVTNNLIIGSILAVFILFLFLRDIKPTLVVGLAIPISVVGAFTLMYAADISLNIVSMGGLALGIGMLVDNSIVVIENIYRLLNEGKSPKEAAINGAGQVANAITASTITTMAVFLPIIFIEGLTADLFKDMTLTVTFSLLASLVIAITLVPSISSRFLKPNNTKEDKFLKKLQTWYELVVKIALRKKIITLITILLLLVLSGFLASTKGFELLPATDEGTITVNVEMIKGTDFKQTTVLTDEFVKQIMLIDEVETVSASIGGSGMNAMFGVTGSSDSSSITILLRDDRKLSTDEVVQKIEKIKKEIDYSKLENVSNEDVYEILVGAQNTTSMAGFGGTGVQLIVKGEDIYKMRDLADKLIEKMKEVEGTKDHSNGIAQTDKVVRIVVNKENAMKRGLTENDIKRGIEIFYSALGFDMADKTNTNLIINVNGTDYEITVPSDSFSFSMTYEELLNQIKVFSYDVTNAIKNKLAEKDENFALYYPLFNETDGSITLVLNPTLRIDEEANEIYTSIDPEDTNPTLASLAQGSVYEGNEESSIAKVLYEDGIASITRDGKTRYLTISAGVETGYQIGKVSNEVEKNIYEYLNSQEFEDEYGKDGYTVEFAGENEDIKKTTGDMMLAAIAAILLVYMVMAIQFQSLKYPFIVMFTIPLAFTGGLFALFLANLPISMVAMVGLIILSGIVVNNGIVLIDYINQLREEGLTTNDAIIKAGKTRLRPILMTALTTILALIPIAIGSGEGGELLQPLGLTSIGGLIYATVLTLIVVPVMYSILNRDKVHKN